MTREQIITRVKHSSMYIDDRETADYIIKALEQQPSDDCVSRAEAIKSIGNNININFEGQRGLAKYEEDVKLILQCLLDEQIKRVEALPSVTPTFPKNMTNGDVIKAVFPNCKIMMANDGLIGVRHSGQNWIIWFTQSWWNAPYKGVEND